MNLKLHKKLLNHPCVNEIAKIIHETTAVLYTICKEIACFSLTYLPNDLIEPNLDFKKTNQIIDSLYCIV